MSRKSAVAAMHLRPFLSPAVEIGPLTHPAYHYGKSQSLKSYSNNTKATLHDTNNTA